MSFSAIGLIANSFYTIMELYGAVEYAFKVGSMIIGGLYV